VPLFVHFEDHVMIPSRRSIPFTLCIVMFCGLLHIFFPHTVWGTRGNYEEKEQLSVENTFRIYMPAVTQSITKRN